MKFENLKWYTLFINSKLLLSCMLTWFLITTNLNQANATTNDTNFWQTEKNWSWIDYNAINSKLNTLIDKSIKSNDFWTAYYLFILKIDNQFREYIRNQYPVLYRSFDRYSNRLRDTIIAFYKETANKDLSHIEKAKILWKHILINACKKQECSPTTEDLAKNWSDILISDVEILEKDASLIRYAEILIHMNEILNFINNLNTNKSEISLDWLIKRLNELGKELEYKWFEFDNATNQFLKRFQSQDNVSKFRIVLTGKSSTIIPSIDWELWKDDFINQLVDGQDIIPKPVIKPIITSKPNFTPKPVVKQESDKTPSPKPTIRQLEDPSMQPTTTLKQTPNLYASETKKKVPMSLEQRQEYIKLFDKHLNIIKNWWLNSQERTKIINIIWLENLEIANRKLIHALGSILMYLNWENIVSFHVHHAILYLDKISLRNLSKIKKWINIPDNWLWEINNKRPEIHDNIKQLISPE